jgi:hypothetical protein
MALNSLIQVIPHALAPPAVHSRVRKERGKEGGNGEEGRRTEKERREEVNKEVMKGCQRQCKSLTTSNFRE